MKILLDECKPRKFRNNFTSHNCLTAASAGLAGLKNGRLLSATESLDFEVFVTIDKEIKYQQNLAGRKIAILVIHAISNRLVDIQ